MIVGINAINLRVGGGTAHIFGLISAACPGRDNFKKIVIWGNSSLLDAIPHKPWLKKIVIDKADMGLLSRVMWQFRSLKSEAIRNGCDVLFVPGGSDFSGFKPIIGMSQNMLPFEYKEIRRYGLSWATAKFLLLRFVQSFHFRNADGVIFLTEYARRSIMGIVPIKGLVKIIPHGIDPAFKCNLNRALLNKNLENKSEVNLLYISNIEYYKHQWNVVEAVARLRSEGFPLSLDLIGAPMRGLSRLKKVIRKLDPAGIFVRFHGEVEHKYLSAALGRTDIFVFASSCENLPITLLEAMASGVPIASSDMGPMPDVLCDAGIYFNPLDVSSIVRAVRKLYLSDELRATIAEKALSKSASYTWDLCAKETFRFLSVVTRNYHQQG